MSVCGCGALHGRFLSGVVAIVAHRFVAVLAHQHF